MIYKQRLGNRITSAILAIALLFTVIPMTAFTVAAATVNTSRTADPSTMDGWKDFFSLSGELSTENAGGVWMDKSVFTDEEAFAGLGISQDGENSFLVALSVMAANMGITGMSHMPTDSILVLDVSGSMNDNSGNNDVAEDLVKAANESIDALLSTNQYNRVGVVLYSGPTNQGGSAGATDAVTILPLGRYTPSADGDYLTYNVTGRENNTTESVSIHNAVVVEGTSKKPSLVSKTVVGATYIQKGVVLAMNQFIAESNSVTVEDAALGTVKRKPVVVLMSDGAPTVGSTSFTAPSSINLGDGTYTTAALGFVTQLSAAYAKAKIEEKYGTSALFYTLGLGLSSSDEVAISVMDPSNANASTAVDDFWNENRAGGRGQSAFKGYNHVAAGETVSVGGNKSVTKIELELKQNYVDRYFEASGSSGDLAGDLAKAFRDIVGAIQLQSSYFPTLVAESEELSGYVSFVDKIGRYMEVTDIKGILIHNYLFSGANLASNFVWDGGALGTWDAPTALGMEMVAAVRARLGIESDEAAATLIHMAYESGQLSYTDENNFSNYIGWYANAAGEFLGFYNEGTTVLPEATGNAKTDPAFIVRSYGYLGEVDESHGVSESDMMYATVQVREEISTGDELVTFAVPAALIPTVTYNVSLDEDGNLTELSASGANNPIRLVYEVALDGEINSFNIKEILSEEYLSDPHHVNANGSINFYTNLWEHENKTGYGTVNTYGYFNPSRQNDKYYYLEDTPVYADAGGTLYTGSAQPSADAEFYRSYRVYKKNGTTLSTETVYRALSDAAKATAQQKADGSWYIPKGNVHVNLDGYTVHKSENRTQTLTEANVPFVDTNNHSINDTGYQFYVGATLGNNGKMTVIPQTGIKLSKTMADGTPASEQLFTFTVKNITNPADGTAYPAWLVKADGTESDTTVTFVGGSAQVELHAGDVLYIGGMTAGQTFEIAEEETVEYLASATGLSASGAVTLVQNELVSVSFINDERGTGNLVISKEIDHDFGVDYQIPQDKRFTIQVTLSGIGTANAAFKAVLSDGSDAEITTDASGRFTVELAHDEQVELFGLPAGTAAAVTELNPAAGFTPVYWDNGVLGDGIVTIEKDRTESVIVVNDYAAAEVYPVNITVFGNKTLVGTDWQPEYAFEFKLEKLLSDGTWQQMGATATASMGSPSFTFTDAFKNEAYTTPGSYYYRIVEIEPAAPLGGFTYDKTVHSFAVHVGDADMDGALEITEVRSDRPATTLVSADATGWSVSASFTNTYSTTGSATVTVDVNKAITNIGGSEKTLAGYVFGLFDPATGAQVGDLLTTTERGFARLVLTYNAAEIGNGDHTFTYILKEVAPSPVPAGWTFSSDEITVTVEITDNGDGTISAVIYQGATKPAAAGTAIETTFTNTYNPADTELSIDFVSKEISGRELGDLTFDFEVQTQDGTPILQGTNDSTGKVTFNGTLKFTQVGTYLYQIAETSADGKGVVTDKTVYIVLVTVTDIDGELSAAYTVVNVPGNEIVFKNTYTAAPVDHAVEGKKTLSDRTLINDEFTFLLTELSVNGTAPQSPRSWSTKNFADGTITFPAIAYDKAGTYVYSVREELPQGGKAYGILYDGTVYHITVVVEDNGEGELKIASETVALADGTAASEISFLNQYEADAAWTQFSGEKTLTGKVNNALQGGEFEFVLYDSDENWTQGTERQKVENGLGGVITFDRIDFTTETDQYFLVKEVNGGRTIDGITYDDTVYRVYVQVTDNLKGQLVATIHIYDGEGVPQDRIFFVNTYEITGGANVSLSGEKTISGRDWQENDSFTFDLYETDETYSLEGTLKTSASVDYDHRSYTISLSYTPADAGKTFYYVLVEQNAGETVNGLTYSGAVYKIKVVVEDDDHGGIKTTVTVIDATTSTLHFVNTYGIVTGTSVQLSASKELTGKELGNVKFSFDLTEANVNWEA